MNYEKLDIKISQDYYAKYIAELTHTGLNEHQVLVDRNSAILENKISTLDEK